MKPVTLSRSGFYSAMAELPQAVFLISVKLLLKRLHILKFHLIPQAGYETYLHHIIINFFVEVEDIRFYFNGAVGSNGGVVADAEHGFEGDVVVGEVDGVDANAGDYLFRLV